MEPRHPLSRRWFWLALLLAVLITGGCAGINRCRETGGAIVDVSALAFSPDGQWLAGGGTLYILSNCVAEEVFSKGPRSQKGLVVAWSQDCGQSWKARRIPVTIPEGWSQRFALIAVAVGDDGALLASINQWTESPLQEKAPKARLLRSSDQGATWHEVAKFDNDQLVGLVALPEGTILAALCGQGVLRSGDNGTSWVPTSVRAGESCFGLQVITDHGGMVYASGWGANGPGWYRSADKGITWIRMMLPPTRGKASLAANGHGEAIATISGPWLGDVYRSGDHGVTWKKMTSPHAAWTEQLAVSGDGTILLKTMDNPFSPGGGSFVSTDSGESWTRISSAWTGANSFPGKDSLVSHPSGVLCAFERIDFMAPPSTWGWEGKVFCSEDKGRSWRVLAPLVDRIPE